MSQTEPQGGYASTFDDLLAAVLLYVDAWECLEDEDRIAQAWFLLRDEAKGAESLTSRERERVFRDAAIREAARRGEEYGRIGLRYGLSASATCQIARAGGEIRRRA